MAVSHGPSPPRSHPQIPLPPTATPLPVALLFGIHLKLVLTPKNPCRRLQYHCQSPCRWVHYDSSNDMF